MFKLGHVGAGNPAGFVAGMKTGVGQADIGVRDEVGRAGG